MQRPTPAPSAPGNLPTGTILAGSTGGLLAVGAAWAIAQLLGSPAAYPIRAVLFYAAVMAVALPKLRAHHHHPQFGPANWVTTLRAALTCVVLAGLGEAARPELALASAVVGAVAVSLDGLDGRLARRSGLASAFGARFDLEIDALLILALSLGAWSYGKAGPWIVVSGLLRYAFVAAAWAWAWMRRPLPPSRRRQTVCVVQIVALLVVLAPWLRRPWSDTIAAASAALLCYSFYIDVRWLWRAAPQAISAN